MSGEVLVSIADSDGVSVRNARADSFSAIISRKRGSDEFAGACAKRRSALWNGGDSVASHKGRKRKPSRKTQKRDILRTVCYLASTALSLVRLAFFFWDRFHR